LHLLSRVDDRIEAQQSSFRKRQGRGKAVDEITEPTAAQIAISERLPP